MNILLHLSHVPNPNSPLPLPLPLPLPMPPRPSLLRPYPPCVQVHLGGIRGKKTLLLRLLTFRSNYTELPKLMQKPILLQTFEEVV